MKFKRANADPIEVNLTPLIDVVFLLLIFFMVSTTFTRETQIAINLPEAEGEQVAKKQNPIEIVIGESGNIAINGQLLTDNGRKSFKDALQQASGGDVTTPMIITADAKAPYQVFITVMDVAGKLGFVNFQMTAQQLKSDS